MDTDFGIKGFLETFFLGGCNFRCPFCHNAELVLAPHLVPSIALADVLERLRPLRGWVDGVVVSGGEPTLSPRLPELLGRLRGAGFEIKIDTNGSRPEVLAKLVARRLVQAVEMDIKAPLEPGAYARLTGVPARVELIRASLDLIRLSGLPHRFRTTYVPGLLDAAAMGRLRRSLPEESPFVVQAFDPRRVLDPALRDRPVPSPDELRAVAALAAAPPAG
jgi:pyruvate formate lyase activating enzyme